MLEKFLHDPEIRKALEYGDKYEHADGQGFHREAVDMYLASEPNPNKDIIILMLIGHALEHMSDEETERHFGRLLFDFTGDIEDTHETPLGIAFHNAMQKMALHHLQQDVEESKKAVQETKSAVATANEALRTLQETRQLVEFGGAQRPDGYKLN